MRGVAMICALLFFTLLITVSMAETSTTYDADLIAVEIISTADSEQNASFNCWLGAVKSLELDTPSLPYVNNALLTTHGANFCSVLAKNQQKALAIELTKCHIQESGRSTFPEVCFADGVSNGLNDIGIKRCLSALSEEGFIIYSQFYIYTEEACSKLTNELLIYRKNDAISRFEQSARMIDEKIQQSIFLQEKIIKRMSEQNEYILQQHEVSIQTREEMDNMMERMFSQRKLIEDQKNILKSVNEIYDQSGFREIVGKVNVISSKKHEIIHIWGPFSLIGISLLVITVLKRFPSTAFLLFTLVLQTLMENAINYMYGEGSITESQHHTYISLLRKITVAMLAILSPYILNRNAQASKEEAMSKADLSAVINTIERRISTEEKTRKKERKQFKEQMLLLQRQLRPSPSFAIPQAQSTHINQATPASALKQGLNTNMIVTPYLNRDSRMRTVDNESTPRITAPEMTSTPDESMGDSQLRIIQTDNLHIISDQYKRKRQTDFSDESSGDSFVRNSKRQKD